MPGFSAYSAPTLARQSGLFNAPGGFLALQERTLPGAGVSRTIGLGFSTPGSIVSQRAMSLLVVDENLVTRYPVSLPTTLRLNRHRGGGASDRAADMARKGW